MLLAAAMPERAAENVDSESARPTAAGRRPVYKRQKAGNSRYDGSQTQETGTTPSRSAHRTLSLWSAA